MEGKRAPELNCSCFIARQVSHFSNSPAIRKFWINLGEPFGKLECIAWTMKGLQVLDDRVKRGRIIRQQFYGPLHECQNLRVLTLFTGKLSPEQKGRGSQPRITAPQSFFQN